MDDPISNPISILTEAPLTIAAIIGLVVVVLAFLRVFGSMLTKISDVTTVLSQVVHSFGELQKSLRETISATHLLNKAVSEYTEKQQSALKELTSGLDRVESGLRTLTAQQQQMYGLMLAPKSATPDVSAVVKEIASAFAGAIKESSNVSAN